MKPYLEMISDTECIVRECKGLMNGMVFNINTIDHGNKTIRENNGIKVCRGWFRIKKPKL